MKNWARVKNALAVVCLLTAQRYQSNVAAGDLRFEKHVVSEKTDFSAAALIDVNHDGRLDIVCGSDWYEGPHWKRHSVATIPRIGGRPDGFAHLPMDVNRDGWMDVITVNYRSRTIKWMEHPGPTLGLWKTHVAAEPGPMETGRLVDIDGDGVLDLLPNGAKFAAWWEFRWKDKDQPGEPAWIRHELPIHAAGHGIGFGDIDGDGRGDIVGQRGWLRAPEDARYGEWHWHPDFSIERGSTPMLVVDPDRDGDNDIVWCSAHGFGVYWLEQTSAPSGDRKWVRHAIDTSWSQGHSPLWVDLDGDGQNELVAGKRYMSHGGSDPGAYDPITVHRYQFNSKSRTWDHWLVSAPGQRVGMGLDPKAGDIDNDGDLDLLASGRSGLYWLENMGAGTSAIETSTAQVGASTSLAEQSWTSPESWGTHRAVVTAAIDERLGRLNEKTRVPLDVNFERLATHENYTVDRVQYHVHSASVVTAHLYTPRPTMAATAGGVVLMLDAATSDEANDIARQIVARGNVALLPTCAEKSASPLGELVWQAMRAADVLQSLPTVNAERIAYVGNLADGSQGLHLAAIDQRFVANVIDARGAKTINDANTYDHAGLIAAIAPRAVHISLLKNAAAAQRLEQQAESASAIFKLRDRRNNLVVSDSWIGQSDSETLHDWLQTKLQQ